MSFSLFLYNKYYHNNQMQPYQQPDTRKSGSAINNEGNNEQVNFTFQWATHIPFKPHESLKLFTLNSILRNNSRYYTNCLIYVKDKTQQEHFKSSIQKDAKLIAKCCSSNELLNISDQFSKAKIFVVRLDENLIDNYHIPKCFDLVFFMSIPKLEDYEKLVRKQIKSQTKSKCGLVINHYSSPADEKMVAQFVEKTKVKTNTYQQLSKQSINLSRYFKLEDISFENKNSQKSQQDIVKSPEVQSKIQTENIQSTKIKRNLNWATYLIVNTEQQYKAGRIMNYIKLRANFNFCIVYTKTENRARFILERLPQQIKNQTSILLNYPKNYLEYLQKLQQKQLKVLIIVNNNQDFQSHSSEFYVPNTVNLIISDNIPTRQTFNQRFGKIKQTNEGGVIVSFVSSYNENEVFRNYCKQNGIKINDQHRKDDYYLDKYMKPPSDNIQKKLKESKSPEKTENLLNKNNQKNTKKQTVNQTNQQLPKKQQTQLQLANKTDVNSSIGGAGGVESLHTSEQDPQQNKAEKKQQNEEKVQSSPPKNKTEKKPNCSDIVGNKNAEQKQQDGQGQKKAQTTQKNNQVAEVDQNIADDTEQFKIELEGHQVGSAIRIDRAEQKNLPQDITANQEIGQDESKKSEVNEIQKKEQGSVNQEISKKTEQVVQKTGQRTQAEQTVQTVQTEKTQPTVQAEKTQPTKPTQKTKQAEQPEQPEQTGQADNSDKKSLIDPTQPQKIQNPPNPQTEQKIEQASQNPSLVEHTNNSKSPSIEIGPQMFKSQQKLKQDTNSLSSNQPQKQLMQFFNTLSTKQLQLSDKFEQLPKKIQQLTTRIDSVGSSIKENTRKINQNVNSTAQQVTDSVSNGVENLESILTKSLQDQKTILQNSLTSITTCIQTQSQKSLDRISQIHQGTSEIKTIAKQTKQILVESSSISASLSSIKQDFDKDIKQLSMINLLAQNTQKQNSEAIQSKIGQASLETNTLIKQTAEQQKKMIDTKFQNINQNQIQLQKKLDQVPEKLQDIYNDTKSQLTEINNKLQKQTEDLSKLLKQQAANNQKSIIEKISGDFEKNDSLIKLENKKILNYIDAEKKRVTNANQKTLQQLKTKKQAMESYQRNRMAQFERKLNEKEKSSSDAGLQKKLNQLQKKYQQSKAEIVTLRTYQVNGVKTSEELDRLKLELSQAKKIEAKFNAYKKKYSIQTAIYNQKQREYDQLKILIAKFQLQIQDLVPIRDELNTAKQTIYSLIQVKSQKKEPEGGSINKMLMKGATSTVTNNMIVKSMAQISKIPKQAQNMNLPTLIKTYLLAQTRTLSDLKPYLSNFVKNFPAKQSDSLLTEWKQTKACMSSFQNALKTIDKQSGSAQLINSILRLIGQYDTLKKYQISISKYNRELQITLRTLNDKTDQVVKKGIQLTPTKILDYNYKESVINVDLQEICKNVNRLLTNFNSKTAQLVKANQLIEELKKQNTTQSTILTGLNGDKNTLTAQLNLGKGQIAKLRTQLTQTQNALSIMTTNYKKTVADLEQTKKKWGQTSTKLTQTQTNLEKVMKTLQYTTKKLSSTENAMKQTTTQLSITKATLQQKQRQLSAQKQQLATNDTDLSKLKRALLDQKARAQEQADEASKIIQNLKNTITETSKNYKGLQQKSIRQIKEQKQKSKQQLKNKQDEIREIRLENENHIAKLLGQMKQFEDSLNKSIKVTLEYEPKLTINNYKDKFPQFSKAILQRQSKSKFLAESSTYRHMNEEDRLFVFESIKRVVNRKIDYTKTLFQGYSGVNFDEWLFKIYNKTNLLVLITLSNGHIIGGFSENAFSKEKVTKGKGYMMSVTNKRIYDIKTRHEGKVAKYDDFMFIFGNNELLIKNNLTFTAIFARQFCYFETGDDKIQDFLGQEQEEGTFKSVEFHQVIFS